MNTVILRRYYTQKQMEDFIEQYKAIEAYPVTMRASTLKLLEEAKALCKENDAIYKDRHSILENPKEVMIILSLWKDLTYSWHKWYKNSYSLTEFDVDESELLAVADKMECIKKVHSEVALARDRLRNEYPLLNLEAFKLDLVMLGFF